MSDLISVIVPVYKVEAYLDTCVESLVHQTYRNLEIILVDDGSPDRCPQMCDEWAEKDSRIKAVHKTNGGVSSARNCGMDAANGEYICFVDSDDSVDADYIVFLYELLKKNNADIAVCGFRRLRNGVSVPDHIHYDEGVFRDNEIMSRYLSDGLCDPCIFNKLYVFRIVKDNAVVFDTTKRIGEDFLFNFDYLVHCKTAAVNGRQLYNYIEKRDGSATNTVSADMINRWQNTVRILNAVKEDSDLYAVCIKRLASELLCCVRELLRTGDNALIDKAYPEIVNEIRAYKSVFKKTNISKISKYSIMMISLFPSLYKRLYQIYLKRK